MQVLYTHVNGDVVTYTANTAITSNVLLGNVTSWASTNMPTESEHLLNEATTKVNGHTTINGVEVSTVFCYQTQVSYFTDYGLYNWARERLDAAEFDNFQSQCAEWTANVSTQPSDNPVFLYWWSKYVTDPNVVFVE